ncbi:tetratricopeptide repeat protein [Amycolatopsis vancoresmycina]|uniref:Orc1-like AAA ATPase domain-containing protein n=1 Tax=Amycolatopsis vancoresmycina DSM 44592 TaxID=1292037 RepID=R1G717_9PSEU|nr:tetratricopeptide repeat protein [Amycolatopsis vancoresmycina]EOD67223.1 hypothetical protein H480_17580 [Amycolatopsis vancoresmycina DSM 44592]
MRRDVFVGVGIDHYAAPELVDLDHAVADVEAVANALSAAFEGEPLTDADVTAVHSRLESVGGRADGGTLLLVWSGHGTDLGGLRLATADKADGVAASEVIRGCVLSGASQLLLVIDTCQAGAVLDSTAMARRLLEQLPPKGDRVWLGVLVSCSAADIGARDGQFGKLLVKLLTRGPDSPDQQRRWSKHNDRILGEDLGLALLEEWPGIDQRPEFLRDGHPLPIVPNPLYDEGAPEEVVEHLLRAARGGDPGDERSWFTGRTDEVDTVVSWVRAGTPGLRVVAGSAGTGKSAVVGRVVSVSNPHERDRLRHADEGWGHADPGERSVAAHVHARGLTVERVAEVLERQLIRVHLVEPLADRRNVAELLGVVQRVVESGAAPPVVVIDGLDEARGQAFAIAEDLLTRLAPFATVIVSTRPLTQDNGTALLDTLSPVAVLDLDSTECVESAQTAIGEYVRKRLAGVADGMDASAVAAHLAGEALAADQPFLLARIITDQLRATPVSTGTPQWREHIAHSIEDAFDADLALVEPPQSGSPDRAAARELARTMLTALTWAVGAGFPEQEWLTVASSLAGRELSRDDVSWVVDQLGRYVVQDGDGGVAVYRLAHQSFADHLRPPYRPTGQEPFNPAALPVGVALLRLYEGLLEEGVDAREPVYLWRYAWVHAAIAGFEGLTALREVVGDRPDLQADVALAALDVADTSVEWGWLVKAVAPTEEAVARYRAVVAEDPSYLPELAMALRRLGGRYGDVGRHSERLALVEESVAQYRTLADQSSSYLPSLAIALNSLGVSYGAVGRRLDALVPAEEAVAQYRQLAEGNPANLPGLATALNGLANRYSAVGRDAEAVASAEEVVALHRTLVQESSIHLPGLAGVLNNLGNRYSAVGRFPEAVPLTEEAVERFRNLAAENPGYLPDLAMALGNLGLRYGAVGRAVEAVVPVEECLALRRVQAVENPGYLPDLAKALSNLGNRYGEVSRAVEGVALHEEAVAQYRELVRENPAYVQELAGALNDLAAGYSDVGRRIEAVASAEEGVALYRELAEKIPGYMPDLAMALSNLGSRYSEGGRHVEAAAAAEEAVALHRISAADNPMHLNYLAASLSTLGGCYFEGGRAAEAVAPAEEAVARFRKLVEKSPAYLPDLVAALTILGGCYSDVRRRDEAVALTEEAVTQYRVLVRENPAYFFELAAALNNLAFHCAAVGRTAEGVDIAEEAVARFRKLVEKNPVYLPNLATALNNLGYCYGEAGRVADAVNATEAAIAQHLRAVDGEARQIPDLAMTLNNLSGYLAASGADARADEAWQAALAEVDARSRPLLLLHRVVYTKAGDPRTAAWLHEVLAEDNRELLKKAHTQARRHRAASPEAWQQAWIAIEGTPLPPWLVVDLDMLKLATGWLATKTYEDEYEYLKTHLELLDETFDIAMEESLLQIAEEHASRYVELRTAARSEGSEAAYRPLLLGVLARQFVAADIEQQQQLVTDRRTDLLDELCLSYLDKLFEAGNEAALVASALLRLVERKPDDELAEVFTAMADPDLFPPLLHAAAGGSDTTIVASLATIAFQTAQTADQAATAAFYLAVSAAIDGDDTAPTQLREALDVSPAERNTWIARLAELGAVHPAVLTLIPTLTETEPDA